MEDYHQFHLKTQILLTVQHNMAQFVISRKVVHKSVKK